MASTNWGKQPNIEVLMVAMRNPHFSDWTLARCLSLSLSLASLSLWLYLTSFFSCCPPWSFSSRGGTILLLISFHFWSSLLAWNFCLLSVTHPCLFLLSVSCLFVCWSPSLVLTCVVVLALCLVVCGYFIFQPKSNWFHESFVAPAICCSLHLITWCWHIVH
jgi:hypothetical protein